MQQAGTTWWRSTCDEIVARLRRSGLPIAEYVPLVLIDDIGGTPLGAIAGALPMLGGIMLRRSIVVRDDAPPDDYLQEAARGLLAHELAHLIAPRARRMHGVEFYRAALRFARVLDLPRPRDPRTVAPHHEAHPRSWPLRQLRWGFTLGTAARAAQRESAAAPATRSSPRIASQAPRAAAAVARSPMTARRLPLIAATLLAVHRIARTSYRVAASRAPAATIVRRYGRAAPARIIHAQLEETSHGR